MKKVERILLIINIICTLLYTTSAVLNFLSGDLISGYLYVFCAVCWLICSILRFLSLRSDIRKKLIINKRR